MANGDHSWDHLPQLAQPYKLLICRLLGNRVLRKGVPKAQGSDEPEERNP